MVQYVDYWYTFSCTLMGTHILWYEDTFNIDMWTHASCTWGHIFVAWGHMYRESYGHMQNCMRTHTFEVRFRVEQIHKNFSSRDVVFVQALRETVVTPIVIQNVGEVTVHSCRSGGFRLHRIRSQITQCVYCVVVRYTPQKCQI